MKKRAGLYITIGCLTPMIMIGVLYVALACYYSDGFSYGTWVNGVYCTGKSVEAINTELLMGEYYDQLEIIDKNGKHYYIDGETIQYSYDYTATLTNIQNQQNPFFWGTNLIRNDFRRISADVSFDADLLASELLKFQFMHEDLYDESNEVTIQKTEDGYVLNDETKELLVKEKAITIICDALNEGKTSIDLKESLCYEDLPVSIKAQEQYDLFDKIAEFQDFTLTYQMGETQELVDSGVVSEWILLDDKGKFAFDDVGRLQLDESKIREYVNSLGEKYDTLNRTREFMSTRGDVITIEGGTYGNDLDEDAEFEFLKEAFIHDATGQTREPEYIVKAKNQGEDDIGGTYIEVDMSLQRLYYYEDYDIVIDSPVVTGNLRTKCGTPVKVCYIYYKQKNRTLRGEGYSSFVYYWMAVYKNIGLHDATWRDKFGGEIYKTNGSHGCINLPKNVAKELYERAEKGTPVIMFY